MLSSYGTIEVCSIVTSFHKLLGIVRYHQLGFHVNPTISQPIAPSKTNLPCVTECVYKDQQNISYIVN